MARADYWAIEQELAEVLRANVQGLTVEVESEMMFSAEQSPWSVIYLQRRTAPESAQPIASGRRMRYQLRFSIWVWCWALEKAAAVRARDDILGEMELVLMANRTLNDKVDYSWIEGGELQTGKAQESNFLSGGEIVLIAEMTASL